MAALAGTYHIIADQGATFTRAFRRKDKKKRVAPFNATSARMQVRESYKSSNVVLELTTGNGRILLVGEDAMIYLLVSAADMAEIPEGLYVYDLELVFNDGSVERMVMGNFTVRANITR